MSNKGTLLVNLGSPNSTSEEDVKNYLNEFLMDKYVIDLPYLLRRFIVSAFILPSRPKESAHAYKQIWQEDGSPLISNSFKLYKKVKQKISSPLRIAMRYGNPSLEAEILKLANIDKVNQLTVIPLYPQFAMSTITTIEKQAEKIVKQNNLDLKLNFFRPFYNNQDYLSALYQSIKPYLKDGFDHILFSYHGLPERHIKKCDVTKKHCLKTKDCCNVKSLAHNNCYMAQSYAISKSLGKKAKLNSDKYSTAFQSRLGKAKWIEPYTDQKIEELAQQGVKNLVVICPSFVADCLETLEEIGIRAKEIFEKHGGKQLTLVPCLNDNDKWVDVVASWCEN